MYCEKCGAEIDENIVCPNCGAKPEKSENSTENIVSDVKPAATENEASAPDAEKADVEKNENDQNSQPEASVPASPTDNKSNSFIFTPEPVKKNKLRIIIPVVAVLAVAAVVVVLLVFKNSRVPKYNNLVFTKDSSIYLINEKKYDKFSEVADVDYGDGDELDGSFLSVAATVIRNDKIIYMDDYDTDEGTVSLYYKERNKKGETEKIDSEVLVGCFCVSEKGDNLIYLKNGSLYINDFEDKEKLASDVVAFAANKDNTETVYTVLKDDEYLVYKKTLKKDAEAEKIASDIDNNGVLYISGDLSEIYYKKDNNIYKYAGGEPEKLVSDISGLETTVTKEGKFYYTKENENKVSAALYFDDNLAERDKNLKKPNEADYPKETRVYGYYYTYTYQVPSQAYYDAVRNYEKKENRDKFRKALNNKEYDFTSYTLFYFDGENSIMVSEDFSRRSSVSYGDYVVAKIYSEENINKAGFNEDNQTTFGMEWLLRDVRDDSVKTVFIKDGKIIECDAEADNAYSCRYSSSDNALYFIDAAKEKDDNGRIFGTLSKLEPSGDKFNVTEVTEEVYSYYILNNNIAILKDVDKSGNGTLYFGDEKVTDNVFSVLEKDGKTLILKDYSTKNKAYSLYLYENKKLTKVADDVCSWDIIVYNDDIIYMADWSEKSKTADLNAFNGKESTKITSDVSIFGLPNGIDKYSPYVFYKRVALSMTEMFY